MGQFRLRDAWVHLHGEEFVATWSRGQSGSRLDKFFLPPELIRCLESCRVLAFPDNAPRISDHAPVSIRLQCADLGPKQDLWRMDPCLLTDPTSVAGIKTALVAEEREQGDWDALKGSRPEVLVKAGRERKVRITRELNETLCRLRIVQSADTLTFAIRDNIALLKARYDRLLRQSSRAASRALVLGRPATDPSVLRHIRAGSFDEEGPVRVPHVRLPEGDLSCDSEDIRAVFAGHFSRLFSSEQDVQEEERFQEAVRAFCGTLPKVPTHLAERLTTPATSEEVWDVLRGMNDASAPGPDGIPLAFYKVLFPTLKAPLLRMANAFLQSGQRPDSFCAGRAFLILKPGGDPAEPSAYRPITLLNADYKLVAALLVRRVSASLPHVISLPQACSVPGQSGFSALSLTRDLLTCRE